MQKLDVIIPIGALMKDSMQDRIDSINFALSKFYAIQTNVDLQVIIVEQSLDGKFYFLDRIKDVPGLKVKKVKIKYPIFNKPWCTNVGVNHARGDYFVIAEPDMYCDTDYFAEALGYMKANKLRWCFMWDKLTYTTSLDKRYLFSGVYHEWQGHIVEPQRGLSEGGLVCFNKEFFKGFGSANEWIEELGGPDTCLSFRAEHSSKTYAKYPMMVYHLHHPWKKKTKLNRRKVNKTILAIMRPNCKRFNNFMRTHSPGQEDKPLASLGNFRHLYTEYERRLK